ncbi:MAG: hypothetical protein ABI689_00745 [Thermoanaerobaculia bacterium]
MPASAAADPVAPLAERLVLLFDRATSDRCGRRPVRAAAVGLALLAISAISAISARRAAAQVEAVSGDFSLWSSAAETWHAIAFEDYYIGDYFGTGCISPAGPLTLTDTRGDITLEVSDGSCPAIDGTSTPGFGVDGSIPQGATLTLTFENPIHGFYSPYGSLAVDKQITLHLLGAGVDETLTSPPSLHSTLGKGFGFVSEKPVGQIVISSNEAGQAVLGYFVGLVASDQTIVQPDGFPCPNATCDFAVAYQLHRPRTFVTPTVGPGDLSQWDEAGVATGLAAGDAICAYWAEQAGYRVPQRFIAFLGYGTTDPLCRVVGLAGSWNGGLCSGIPIPSRLARWWRVDGLPWGTSAGGPNNLRPSLDVDGSRVDETYFTGWHPAPTLSCSDWTSAAGGANVGDPNSIAGSWVSTFTDSCAVDHPLLCVERALGLPIPAESAAGRSTFVTRAAGPGDILSWPEADPLATTGLEAADSICQGEAATAGLAEPASFRAWLSTSAQNALDRLTEGPFVRPDGILVAASIADLVDGHIETGIARYADQGGAIGLTAWTGTSATGSFAGTSCGAWDSLTGEGRAGSTAFADGRWTDQRQLLCNFDAHLLCMSDAASVLFADGFEISDTSAWSATVP